MKTVKDVKEFWENNPLFSGESKYEVGTSEFFEEHRKVYIEDCFAGQFDLRCMPPIRINGQQQCILDLGCGVGFWVCEFGMRGLSKLCAADLTERALEITKKRLNIYQLEASLIQQNAENLSFDDEMFDHVNCQGVVHHTPDTLATIKEIARVIKPDGTASISVYYRNPILRFWPYISFLAWPLVKLKGGLKGRGRENIFLQNNSDEIVRLYDGSDNPIGKSYSRQQFVNLLEEYFIVKETFLHFFPARALPFQIPKFIHRWLDKKFGFLIYASVQKK